MNAEQILKTLFPRATEYSTYEMQGRCSGLEETVEPENCEILGRFDAHTYTLGRQEHMLVKMNDGPYVYLRVCDAAQGSGYAKFAALLQISDENLLVDIFNQKEKYLS
ncbi:hypothetical protein NW77_020 [Erwinia phage phiEa2809]|uniref:Uncharacterized protein n=1 Tax=Erwinia phage phiEa2809 TaxID=1564096 RepID=A0A0A0YXB7_9CAUD|nr:hypothetical protein NW77_020 [Erwinia phage phiEa2809]AIX13028.1 hypothetical protein NW77_020 [Erwinia phage phiEa2809]